MKKSLEKLIKSLPEGIDGAIINSDLNRRYFTDLKSSAGTLLVTKDVSQFIIDFRYIEKAKETLKDVEVVLQGDKITEQINEFFKKHNCKNIALESDEVTIKSYNKFVKDLPDFNIINDDKLSDLIGNLRKYKTKDELDLMRKAQSITDNAFSHILNFIKIGRTEREIAIELETFMKKQGSSGLSFDSIVVSGVNSSLPHGVPTDKEIQDGDFLTMDFGANWEGYCSDMTRTIAVGSVSDEQRQVYDIVLKAQTMAIDAIAVGKKCSDIDKVARDHIYNNGFEGKFGHGLGHSLGLFIHESPRFSSLCHDEVEEGIVMTIEPGVYLPGKFGLRIEDMGVVTKDGCDIFTKSDKNLIIL